MNLVMILKMMNLTQEVPRQLPQDLGAGQDRGEDPGAGKALLLMMRIIPPECLLASQPHLKRLAEEKEKE